MTAKRSRICSNHAIGGGGGAWSSQDGAEVVNTTFSGNSGGALTANEGDSVLAGREQVFEALVLVETLLRGRVVAGRIFHTLLAERILVIDGSMGALLFQKELQEADFRGERP